MSISSIKVTALFEKSFESAYFSPLTSRREPHHNTTLRFEAEI